MGAFAVNARLPIIARILTDVSFFSDVLLEAAVLHPKCEILVFCGHTHVQVADNLRVVTGSAERGKSVG